MLKFLRNINSDFFIALFVLCVAALLFVPLPTALLDVLIAGNIAFSLLLLLIGLSLNNVLSLLTFPTLLLLSTLFRLSLNVASSRLILSQGNAGEVIHSFGTFLIQGELVVGIIIFLMLTIINLIVITRGASRVSEVAARFTLDALPGKQLTIDSDLRTGLISAEDAKKRREDLRKESQVYGSMDGAMKFVQGDAIAGIFIICANMFGGMYLGLRSGLSFGDALQTYTVLTIGDGLVTQIPALLVSSCAGFVVTRVSTENTSTLSSDLVSQLLRNRKILFTAAVVTAFIGFLPGLPVWPFLFASFIFVFLGFFIRFDAEGRQILYSNTPQIRQISGTSSHAKMLSSSVSYNSNLKIYLSADLIKIFSLNQNFYFEWWKQEQLQFQENYGVDLPDFQLLLRPEYSAGEFNLINKDYSFYHGNISAQTCYVEIASEQLACYGIKTIKSVRAPISQRRVSLVLDSSLVRSLKSNAQLAVLDALQFIIIQAKDFYFRNPEQLFTLTNIHLSIKEIENHFPGLFTELFANNFFNSARLLELSNALFRSGLYYKNVRTLLEDLAVYSSSYGKDLIQANEFNISDIVDFLRMQNKRQIVASHLNHKKSLKVIYAGADLKHSLLQASKQDRSVKKQLLKSLETVYDSVAAKSNYSVMLLVPNELRLKLNSLLIENGLTYSVISYNEIDPAVSIEPLGTWNYS